MQYYQTVPGGLTGYVNGGWTGVGSGSPNAFGYIDPTNTGSVYIAPNITFDFTEIGFQGKTPAAGARRLGVIVQSALLKFASAGHRLAVARLWSNRLGDEWQRYSLPGYTQQMYTDFIAYAFNAGYEFVTSEDLAARIAAQQKATLSETTSGNVITATITPDPTAPDLGAMALNVINGAAGQVIQNAGTWYAYDTNSIFLPYGGGTFNVTLGTTQDDVTHIDALPMRADLLSVTGDGSNLTFAMTGDGVVDVHVKTPGANVDLDPGRARRHPEPGPTCRWRSTTARWRSRRPRRRAFRSCIMSRSRTVRPRSHRVAPTSSSVARPTTSSPVAAATTFLTAAVAPIPRSIPASSTTTATR